MYKKIDKNSKFETRKELPQHRLIPLPNPNPNNPTNCLLEMETDKRESGLSFSQH